MKLIWIPLAFLAVVGVGAWGCGTPAGTGNTDGGGKCTPKTCESAGWSCGTMDDGCDGTTECGSCVGSATCGGGGVEHECGVCKAEAVADFCTRFHRNCGSLTAPNLCKVARTVDCGTCTVAGDTCGGAGATGQCGNPSGCTSETVFTFCSRQGKNCGVFSGQDNCQRTRSEDCGTCAAGNNCVANVCVPSVTCGNGSIDTGEVCDGANLSGQTCQSQGFASGTLACAANCAAFNTGACVPSASCGNGAIDTGEVCDGANLNGKTCLTEGFASGNLLCGASCKAFNTSGCVAAVNCGNGVIDGSEDCDKANLNGKTCQALGFASGTLFCSANCKFNFSLCVASASCGNGAIEGGEDCDGTNLNGKTCSSIPGGFTGGTLTCNSNCTLNMGACVSFGADAGTPGEDAGIATPGQDAGPTQHGDAGVCAGTSSKAQLMPLDIYMMLDYSGSMTSGSKWTNVTSAIKSFIAQPLTGVSVGLQYFGVPASHACTVSSCTVDSDCGVGCGPCDYGSCSAITWGDSCWAPDYANPAVEIALLPGAVTALNASINAHNSPDTMTPTSAALQGAVDHAKAWATSHPGHVVIDILATDGDPTVCDYANMTGINAIAAAGKNGTPKVLTFVIGVGTSLTNLNGIAQNGGSDCAMGTCTGGCDPQGKNYACLVDTGGNVNQQFLAALNAIRGAALGCNYQIPPPTSGQPDYTKVNVQYKPGNGGPMVIFQQVTGLSACPSTSAWYYDNPSSPTQIILCPTTCSQVEADTTGEVDVVVGCKSHICKPTETCFD